ncbi:MAG: epoxyalkane--coenzyme M transferase, partial [Ilumatobacteraceae bacterium]
MARTIASTHTGSLPRPDDLIKTMWALGDGVPVDQSALEARFHTAIDEIVRKQVEAGVTVINDGEMTKPSYATYVKDRLSGFNGESVRNYHFQDLVDYPRSAEAVNENPGRQKRNAPACTGPIEVIDRRSAVRDMEWLAAAAKKHGHDKIFTSAASPGVISIFFANQHYKTQEEYVFAIAEAMRHEYEAIANAGAVVQLDCPDLAMGRHSAYASLSLE